VVVSSQAAERARRALDERSIEREVVAAFQAYEARRAELQRLTDAAVPAAQRAFELADVGFRAGRFDWYRVALAARELVRARGAELDALSGAWAARIALEQAVGGLQ
jgi:cobalt-zinc-cadmium efflux system outer membrane protein